MPDPSSSPFSLPLLQAINNWQIGGGKNQKAKRGQELKRQAASLPDRFRSLRSDLLPPNIVRERRPVRLNDILSCRVTCPISLQQLNLGHGDAAGVIAALGGADEQGSAGRRGLGETISRPVAAGLSFPRDERLNMRRVFLRTVFCE
jgi:hypothetical protein